MWAFGAFDIQTKTITLQSPAGATGVLNMDNGGNVNWGPDGLVTVPYINTLTVLKLADSLGVVRQFAPSITGAMLYNGTQLADINMFQNYSTTAAMNTAIGTALNSYTTTATLNRLLSGKQDSLIASSVFFYIQVRLEVTA